MHRRQPTLLVDILCGNGSKQIILLQLVTHVNTLALLIPTVHELELDCDGSADAPRRSHVSPLVVGIVSFSSLGGSERSCRRQHQVLFPEHASPFLPPDRQ